MSNPRKQVMVGMGALAAAIGGYMYTKRWEVQGVAIPMSRKGLLAPSPSLNVDSLEKEDRPKREDLVKKESPQDTEDTKSKKDPLKKEDSLKMKDPLKKENPPRMEDPLKIEDPLKSNKN